MKRSLLKTLFALAFAAAVSLAGSLTACGGSGEESFPQPPVTPPEEPGDSVDQGTALGAPFADSALYSPQNQAAVLDDVAHRYFNFFWLGYQNDSKMALRGTQRGSDVLSLGGCGFGLTALPVAVERGWITRAQAAERWLQACQFFTSKAQRYHGAWAHWISGSTGAGVKFSDDQVSAGDLVESGFLTMGMQVCSEYFNGSDPSEIQARSLAEGLWNSVEWKFYTNGDSNGAMYWAWDEPSNGFVLKIVGPNEGLPAYILALAAPAANRIAKSNYDNGWIGARYSYPGRTTYDYKFELGRYEKGQPLFASQHPYLWLDPAQMRDNYADYWEFTTNHAMINRHYCLHDPAASGEGYNESMWGLSASYAPDDLGAYKGRCPEDDDGVVATCASIGAISAAPYYAFKAILGLRNIPALQGIYGVTDSYVPTRALADPRYLAVAVLPLVSIIENYRTGLVRRLAMQNSHVREGLATAGFRTPTYPDGFYHLTVDTYTGYADLMANPDTGSYAIEYYLAAPAQKVTLTLSDGTAVRYSAEQGPCAAGAGRFAIPYSSITKRPYTARLLIDNRVDKTVKINMR